MEQIIVNFTTALLALATEMKRANDSIESKPALATVTEKPADTTTAAPAAEKPKAEKKKAEPKAEKAKVEAPVAHTIDTVRVALIKYCEANTPEKGRELMTTIGKATKLSEVKPGLYPALMDALAGKPTAAAATETAKADPFTS
ncbi:MAG: hypothetical protein WCS70_06885 [Verrucomicrobiota bacterium]